MTTTPQDTPPGATLHLGGHAYASPALQPLLVPIADVLPYPGNPRRHDQDNITGSIRDHGLYAAVVVQASTGYTLVGNGRRQALLDLGAEEIPVVVQDVDDVRAAAIVARDNRTSDLSGYDDRALLDLLALMADDADVLALAGYEEEDLQALREAVDGPVPPVARTDQDEAPRVPAGSPVSKFGDVWRLGPHRLVVGDATDPSAYAKVTGEGGMADCIWTDPPYGVEYVGKTKEALSIQNDGAAGLPALLSDSLGLAVTWSSVGSPVYVASPPGPLSIDFGVVLRDLGVYRQTLIWTKDVFVLGHSDYHYKHEPIFLGYVPGAQGRRGRGGEGWYGDNSQTSVLDFPRPKRSKEHPTMKPVDLVAYCLRNSTAPGDVVLDPFAGSGTTLIACHREDRTARLIELDPRYADVICRRYQEHTGTLPVRDGQQVDFTTA